jgi:HEAT repeat protein
MGNIFQYIFYPKATKFEKNIKLLREGDDSEKARAALELGLIEDKQAVGQLCIALKSSNRDVQKSCIQALLIIKDEAAINPLIATYDRKNNEDNLENNQLIIKALTNIMGERAIPFLIGLLYPENPTCLLAIVAIKKIGSSSAIDPLINLYNKTPDDEKLRLALIQALSAFKAPYATLETTTSYVGEFSESSTYYVYAKSHVYDARIANFLASALQDDNKNIRLAAIDGLCAITAYRSPLLPEMITPIIDAFRHDDKAVRDYARPRFSSNIMQWVSLIVASDSHSPKEKLGALRILREDSMVCRMAIPSIEIYCNCLKLSKNELVKQGASDILGVIEEQKEADTLNKTLLRASDKSATDPKQLLRARIDEDDEKTEQLLRADQAARSDSNQNGQRR